MKRKFLLMTAVGLFAFGSLAFGQVIDESFETWPPAGWTMDPSSGTGSWQQDDGSSYGPGSAYDGSYAAMFDNYNYSSGTTGSMITPTFDVSSVTNPMLSFYWWNNDGSSNPATLDVYSSTDGTTWTLIETIDTYGSGATTWVHYTHSLSTSDIQVKLTATSDYGLKNTFVDKFVIEGVSCPAPSAQTETNITVTSADLGWTENGTATTWNIEWGPTGFTQGSGTMITGTGSNPYSLSGLSENTTYDWYVQADCGGGDESAWVGPSTFTTTVACPAPTTQTETNITSSSAGLGWTAGGSETTWNIEWGPTGFTQGSGTMITGVTSNPYTLSGLTAATDYDWYVQADCGGGSSSTWTGPSTFTTACATVTTLSEDFSSTSTPTCWDNSGTESWLFSTGAGYGASSAGDHTPGGGTNYAWIDGSGDIQQNALITPYINVSGFTTPAFEFYYFSNNTNNPGDDNTLTVDFWDGAAWNTLLTYSGDNASWQQGIYDLSGYTITGDVQFRFVVTGTATTQYYNDILVDDVSVIEMPSCPAPTAQTETNITATAADLGWTENGTATTWNIEWGPTGFTQGSGTMITGTTQNPYTLSGLAASTIYDWYVQSDCGGGSTSSWVGPGTFTTLQTPAPVQSLPFTEDWETGAIGAAWNYDAGSVSTIEVNTASAHNGTYGLEQYGNSSTGYSTPTDLADAYTKAQPGGTNENWTTWNKFSVDLTSTSNPWLSFWYAMGYEYNDNYNNFWVQVSTDGSTWTDLFSTQTNGAAIPYEKKDFDLSTYNGTAQLYIRFFHNGKYNTNYLWLDDISVQEVSCPAPTAQTETNITTTSADLGWTENGTASTWNIEWGPTGFTQGSGTMITGTGSNPYPLSGLSAGTTYDWYVQADCGGGSSSSWTGTGTFTTACASVSSYPFTESFEGAVPPNCWSEVRTPSSTYGWSSNSSGYTGNCARFDSYLNASGNVSDLITPTFDLTSLTTAQLKFVFKNPTGGDFSVLLSTDGGATYPNTIWSGLTGQADWVEKIADITAYIGSNVKIAFKGTSNYGSGDAYIYLDDVTVEEIPSCPAPTAQTESNMTMTSADLGWTAGGSETTWNIEWGPTGFTQGSGTTITGVTSNPYTLSGLTASTTYDWYVQAGCGSTWTGPSTFTTACGTTTVPYFENFDGVTAPAFPPCMTVEDVNGDNIVWETTSSTSLSPPNSAMITYDVTVNMDDWFFTQGLQLTGGVTYEVSFAYSAASDSYPEKLAVDWGNAANAASMSGTPIFDDNNVTVGWWAGSGTFTPATTGTYYVGFHGYSDMNMFDLYVDDVKILEQVTATTWNGSVDNDWDTPANWSAGLPSSGTDVTIPTGLTNYPTLNTATTIGSLTVESDATGDASVLNDGLLVVTGNATVQRYITGGVWHDVSASTQGQTLNSLYFNHSPDVWLRHYNEPDNTRTYLYVLTDPMPSGAGFEIWVETGNNVTVNYTGALQRSNVTLTTTSTPPLNYTGPEPLGYNLIGNPFASPLDLDEGTWSLTDVSTSFWVWDPNSGTSGTYLDWNTAGSTGSLTGGVVPMGQGFFIQATGASPSITIPMAARVHSSTGFYKNSAADDGDGPLHMSLRALMDNGYDEMNIAFISEASQEFDTYDTRKMFAFEGDAPQIYSEQYGQQLSINGLPLLTPEGYDVKVGYRAGINGDQTIEANLKDLPETEVLLEDLVTGNVQSLVDEPRYKFEAYVDDDPIRFVLHFNPVTTGVEGQIDDLGIRVYAFDGSVYIQSKGKVAKEKKDVWIVDMFGRTVLKTTVYPSTLNRIPVNMDDAFIIVRTVCESGIKTTKLYIK